MEKRNKMRRCLNDPFGYCSGEPEVAKRDEVTNREGVVVNVQERCKLNPKTCGKYQTISQQIDTERLKQIEHSHVTTTIIKATKEANLEKKKTKVSIKERKEREKEMQKVMF